MAKNFLQQANISYKELLATENVELARSLVINSAPTLIVVNNGEVEKVENVSNIRRYIEVNLVNKGTN